MEKNELKNFVFASLISADNDELEEDVKQELIARYKPGEKEQDWKYILEPIKDEQSRNKLIELLESCEQ